MSVSGNGVAVYGMKLTARDVGLVMNVDGDDAFTSFDVEESKRALRLEMLRYADAGVKTMVYSATAGSEVMLYPTKVGVNWGWKASEYDRRPGWDERIKRNKANQDAGSDALATVADACRESGMKFVPALRMNDAHYAFAAPVSEYPLTGKFLLENGELTLGVSPIKGKPQYGNLLDFSHAKVRAHRLAQAREIIERYADVMAGFELDFARFQVFFPPGTAGERAHLMTELVRNVRAMLDHAGAMRGVRYAFFVRVPPAIENCTWSGMEVQKWGREGLVDVISPGLMMNAEFDARVEGFQRALEGTGVLIYPAVLPRVGYRWERLEAGGWESTRDLTLGQLRAIAVNARVKGADGLYLFNCQHWPRWRGETTPGLTHAAVRQLGDIQAQASQGLTFTVAKSAWQDHEDTYEYKKAIPAKLGAGGLLDVMVYVGLPGAEVAGRRVRVAVGLRDVPATAGAVSVWLNGALVGKAGAGEIAVAEFTRAPRQTEQASHWFEATVGDEVLVVLKQGANVVSVGVENGGGTRVTDVEVEIGPRGNGV
jgi:hypothetical protein